MTGDSRRQVQGVLWYMDGTLVNTEPRWIEGQAMLAAEFGVPWTEEDSLATVGKPMPVSAAALRARGVPLSVEEIIDRQLAHVVASLTHGIPWLPGALEVLTVLRTSGIPCAMVTMAYRPVAVRVAAGAPAGTFVAVVAGDDVANGKPHPEPYLTGATRIGVDPAACVAVEDTLNGTLSAEAAGCAMLTVREVTPIPAAPGRSRVASLQEVDLAMLARIARGEVIDTLAD
ncbi:MAG: HAD family phosphatase [Thermomicrobiales bacterium]